MAETTNSVFDINRVSDIETRLAQAEAALGRTNLVAPVAGFAFIDGDAADVTGNLNEFGIGSIKIYSTRIPFPNFKPGDTSTNVKYQLDLSTDLGAYKKIWISAVPVVYSTDNNEWAAIKLSAAVRKIAAGTVEDGKYSVVLNSDAAPGSAVTYTAYVDFMAIALY